MKSNTIKIEKKRYLLCPQCHTYTRMKMSMNNPSWFLKHFFIGRFASTVMASERNSDKWGVNCKKCGNREGLAMMFLKTEVGSNKVELAYYTEANERVSLI